MLHGAEVMVTVRNYARKAGALNQALAADPAGAGLGEDDFVLVMDADSQLAPRLDPVRRGGPGYATAGSAACPERTPESAGQACSCSCSATSSSGPRAWSAGVLTCGCCPAPEPCSGCRSCARWPASVGVSARYSRRVLLQFIHHRGLRDHAGAEDAGLPVPVPAGLHRHHGADADLAASLPAAPALAERDADVAAPVRDSPGPHGPTG